MTRRLPPRPAAAMLAVYVGCMIPGIILGVANENITGTETASLLMAFTSFMVVGALVVARRPANRLGWVLVSVGLLAGTGLLAQEYAEYAYVTQPGSLPNPVVAAWYASWYWLPMIGLAIGFTPLLFPSGGPPTPRWRPVGWLLGTSLGTLSVLSALNPRLKLQEEEFEVTNPIGIAAIGDVEHSPVGAMVGLLIAGALLAVAVSLVVRFRRSRGVERQQLKWFTYAVSVLALTEVAEVVGADLGLIGDIVFGLALALLPVSMGIAILRHRLYDIDRVINRTVVYVTLTTFLGASYLGSVTLLQIFSRPLTEGSDLAVAASTLAVAAAFGPARHRIQTVVDRRFYRQKYDAARAIESFSSRLRNEVELEALSGDVLSVVRQTVQPAHASLWLRANALRPRS